ncbi:MAG: glycosyltransferase [Chlamydiota bacterium]
MKILPFILSFCILSSSFGYSEQQTPIEKNKTNTKIDQKMRQQIKKYRDLHLMLRKLWADHVIWTRQFIIASVANTPDTEAATERLLKNQEDLGNVLISYYGKETADSLTALLKEHIRLTIQMVQAAIAHQSDALKKANMKGNENAEKIANFLNNANPKFEKKDFLYLLKKHLDLTSEELNHRMDKNWKEDVNTFDRILDQALSIADALYIGILKQFAFAQKK